LFAAGIAKVHPCGGAITLLLATGGSITTMPVPPLSAPRRKLARVERKRTAAVAAVDG
jgi:hypothetical protein